MNELNYEGLPVFSKMFLSIIKSIKQKSKNPILDYILNKSQRDFSPKIRLVTLADHMLIDITDEEKEKLKNTLGYTPQGKPAIVDQNADRNISKKYRQSGSIGTVLKNLIEFDSITVKTTEVNDGVTSYIHDNVLDCHIDKNLNLPVFFLSKHDWKESKKIEYRKTKFTDSQYEEVVNLLKAEVEINLPIEEVSGSDISKYYRSETYSDKFGTGGNLFSSCMRGSSNTRSIKFYDANPDTMKMVIIRDKDKILGRSMLFLTNLGWCMERRYIAQDYMEQWFINYARSKKYHYKAINTFDTQRAVNLYNYKTGSYEKKDDVLMTVKVDKTMDSGRVYPYMDTFDYLLEGKFVSNYCPYMNNVSSFRIKSTGGDCQHISGRLKFTGESVRSGDEAFETNEYSVIAPANFFVKDFRNVSIPANLSVNKTDPNKNFCPFSLESCIAFDEHLSKKED